MDKYPIGVGIGIDPGTATLGWGVISWDGVSLDLIGYGCVMTSKEYTQPYRLSVLYKEIIKICGVFNPDWASIEELFFSSNAKTAMSVAESRGVSLMALNDFGGLEINNYKPNVIKKRVTGNGRSGKEEVIKEIGNIFNIHGIRPDDAADALAVAVTHLRSC